MTTLAERASALARRVPLRRLELSRKGECLAELACDGEPRWLEVGDGVERELAPERDEELPFAAKLPQLRRERGAVVRAWRPGRRMVVRMRREGSTQDFVFVKALRAGRMRAALEHHVEGARAARQAGLGSAEVLWVEPSDAAFALADLGDRRVGVAAAAAGRFERLGEALARFQSDRAGPPLPQHGVPAELEVLDALASKTIRLRGFLPAGWEPARQAAGAALRALASAAPARTHRDLHDRQLLEHEHGVALLDFDLLTVADEALDPANLLAHLELRVLQGLATQPGAAACAAAFRAGYGRRDDAQLERRLAAWCAATLLRLALVYHLRPPYSGLGPTLVERARERLGEVRDGAG